MAKACSRGGGICLQLGGALAEHQIFSMLEFTKYIKKSVTTTALKMIQILIRFKLR